VKRRDFPEETIFLVVVKSDQLNEAILVGNEIDDDMAAESFDGFVTVRPSQGTTTKPTRSRGRVKGVHDPRALALVELLTSRSRTSDALPSLHYVVDGSANLAAIQAPRNHLILGRRGVGKTALMLEGKRSVADQGSLTAWINLQVLRRESPERMLLYVIEATIEAVLVEARDRLQGARTTSMLGTIYNDVSTLLSKEKVTQRQVDRLIPVIQRALNRYLASTGGRLYVFLDDFYFVPRSRQANLLDSLHSCLRDCDAWLKISSIQSLTRWFVPSPPTGLQTGQDVDLINLDVTLQDPSRAKRFLESILATYASASSIDGLGTVFRSEALDRLVLACGGVPRDYLVLAASAIAKAQGRPSSRLAGVQDVNEAAGDAAQAKTLELEEDLSAEQGEARTTLETLESLRRYCLDEVESTFYKVDFRDREAHSAEYALLVNLSELRLNHMINHSLSDAHQAGEKYEVFMLDLSQFSGSRLKKGVEVIDLVGGVIHAKRTGQAGSTRQGRTPRMLNTILRSSPTLTLGRFERLVPE
jgi:hypothetical protein